MFSVMRFFIITLTFIFFSACALNSGHEKEGLSQNHYNEPGANATEGQITGIPIFSRNVKKNTLVKGQCVFKHNGHEYPVKYTKVGIFSDKGMIADASTDNNGNFSFYVYLNDGDYKLIIDSIEYKAEDQLKIHGLKHFGIKLIAYKK